MREIFAEDNVTETAPGRRRKIACRRHRRQSCCKRDWSASVTYIGRSRERPCPACGLKKFRESAVRSSSLRNGRSTSMKIGMISVSSMGPLREKITNFFFEHRRDRSGKILAISNPAGACCFLHSWPRRGFAQIFAAILRPQPQMQAGIQRPARKRGESDQRLKRRHEIADTEPRAMAWPPVRAEAMPCNRAPEVEGTDSSLDAVPFQCAA